MSDGMSETILNRAPVLIREQMGDTDLLVLDGALQLDAAGQPRLIHGRDCIAQDIRHLLSDLETLTRLLGERSSLKRELALKQVVAEVEADPRIVPGSCTAREVSLGQVAIRATTEQYGEIDFIWTARVGVRDFNA